MFHQMDPYIVLSLVIAIVAIFIAIIFKSTRLTSKTNNINSTIERLEASQAELAGRLGQFVEIDSVNHQNLSDRMHKQEIQITKMLDARLTDVTKHVGESLQQSSTKSAETLLKLQERLAVIDAAQKNIKNLSEQVVELQDVLSNRHARGAFGEIQLQDLVQAALPPSAYEFQKTLGNGKRADCILKLPNPPGFIAIDAKFPLESYHGLRSAPTDTEKTHFSRTFDNDVQKHVKDIAGRYIIPGETAESALMFLPSEAVYAELYANHPETVEKSYHARVWIVSPTTLMATLNTIRAVLKDASMQEQAGIIQAEVSNMLIDVNRLDERVDKLHRHFGQAEKDLRDIRVSSDKIVKRGERIEEIEFGDENQNKQIDNLTGPHQLEQK